MTSAQPVPGPTTIRNRAGLLEGRTRGARRGAARVWLGVPFAAPPVGGLRFRPPQPVRPWSGVRPAGAFAGAAAQLGSLTAPVARLGSSVGEDCLYLNVHAPAAAPERPGRGRPVVVWVHGGSFTGGSAALYDGAALAARGDVVVVTVNYRLGVFGFVDLSAATGAEVASNLGVRDVIAALSWVREEIAGFGGDPDRVTLAGESAGSVITAALLSAPSARGLFSAAVLESGSFSLTHGPATRVEVAEGFARELGLDRSSGADALQRLPTGAFLTAQATVDEAVRGTTAAAPWFDGDVLAASAEAARAVPRPDVRLLAGSNRDEITMFQVLPGEVLPTRREDLTRRLHAELGADGAQRVLAHYPAGRAGTRALGTDLAFALPTLHTAERHAAAGGPTWCYRLDAAVPLLGATHAAELPLLWDWTGPSAVVLAGPRTRARLALADRVQEHWLGFVRDGAPGAGWPRFELPARRVLVLDRGGDHVEADPGAERRAAWDGADVPTSP